MHSLNSILPSKTPRPHKVTVKFTSNKAKVCITQTCAQKKKKRENHKTAVKTDCKSRKLNRPSLTMSDDLLKMRLFKSHLQPNLFKYLST